MSNVYKNVLIVIGAPPNKEGKPSHFMVNRLRKAIQLHNKNSYSRILFTGGQSHYPVPSSDIMRVMSLKHLPSSKIILERNAKDLLQNALFCWELIKDRNPKHITIVTSDWNMKRARYIFKKTYSHLKVSLKFEEVDDQVDFVEHSYLWIKEFLLLAKIRLFGIR